MEQKNTNKKLLRVILLIGILLYIIGSLIGVITNSLKDSFDQMYDTANMPIYQVMMQLPYVIVILMTVIVAPIMEEIIFRIWTKGKPKYDILSFVAIAAFCYYISAFSLWVYIPMMLLLFCVFFFLKNRDSLRLILLVTVTSMLFGLSHINNDNGFWPQCSYILVTSGMGFVFAWIGLRFRFIYCILAHGLNNLLVTIIIFGLPMNTTTTFASGANTIEIKNDIFSTYGRGESISNDSIKLGGTLSEMASNLAKSIYGTSSDTIYLAYAGEDLKKYQLTVHAKNGPIDKKQLLHDFIAHSKIDVDTVIEKAYVLKIKDTSLLRPNGRQNTGFQIRSLVSDCQKTHKIPLLYDQRYVAENIEPQKDYYSNFFFATKEEACSYLDKTYGIEIKESDSLKAICIRFKK